MHWICPLYKLSTCWAQQVERIWTPCWEMLSGVERFWVLLSQIWNWSNFSLSTAQHFLYFAVIYAWLNKVECICTATLNMLSPRTRSAQRIQKFVKSSDCSSCWVIVKVIWTPRSTTPQQTLNMLRACTVDKSSAFARSLIHLIPKWRPINYSFVCMLISPLCLHFGVRCMLFTNCTSIVKSGVSLVKKQTNKQTNKQKVLESHGSNTNYCSSEALAKAVGCFVSVDGQNCGLRGVLLCKRTLNQCS